uniref:Glycosyltransferase 2-like domain-containing protein n=1 Tax=viral metagenome TaxID=1070528 RepID=A0A6C0K2K8_9ZZZZ
MNTYRCVIIGCAKNVAAHLPSTLAQIDVIRSLWLDAAVVIAENGSTDSTKQLLAEYAATKSHTHILTLDEANSIPLRTERLALVRNRLLDFVHETYSHFDYILSVDLDGILDGFKSSGLTELFKSFPVDTWDAVFANVAGKYYDIWALRSAEMGITYDCWDMILHLRLEGGVSRADAKAVCVTQFQKVIEPSPSRLIPVESAFGGLGLYRLAATRGCTYVGITRDCSCQRFVAFNQALCASETCEHVSFHKDMVANGAKLFICSSLLVKTQQEHL